MGRRHRGGGEAYQIEVSKYHIPDLVKLLRKHGQDQQATEVDESITRFGAKTVTVDVEEWDKGLIEGAIELFVDERNARAFLRSLLSLKAAPAKGVVKRLVLLPQALSAYLAQDAIDGWVYLPVLDGKHVAYVVVSIDYVPEERSYQHYRPEYVVMELKANRAKFSGEGKEGRGDGIAERSITFQRDCLAGTARAADILLRAGVIKETAELKAAYTADLDLFQKYQPRECKQFWAHVRATDADTGYWWDTDTDTYPLLHPTRMINDEGQLGRKITLACTNWYWHKHGVTDVDNKFARVPMHPFILMFDLVRHVHCWVHVSNLKPYKYSEGLRDKLVLPEAHKDLIDVLTEDLELFEEDIIQGKAGGTAILCYGPPGLGKTLTAEVYSEVVKRPLYRVAAGQLGTDVEDVEKSLTVVLRRAERWKAVLLLDEADVYIRQRSNDIQHNAVVACFLQTLEYFHGLLFMTTNRASDVDDAIASRMVATFKYELPTAEDAVKIWKVLASQFGLALSDKAIEALVGAFPQLAGRDIKQLIRLTTRYCRRKQIKLNLSAFKTCAMFRGII